MRRRDSALADANFDFDAGSAQPLGAVAGDFGIGIEGGRNHALDSGGDECLGAGAGAAGVIAGFQGDVCGAAMQAIRWLRAGLFQGDNFGVVEEVVFMPALADHLAGRVDDDAAHGGIGRGEADAAPGEFESPLHPVRVLLR